MNCKLNLAVLGIVVCWCTLVPGCVSTEDQDVTGDAGLKAGIEHAFPMAAVCAAAAKAEAAPASEVDAEAVAQTSEVAAAAPEAAPAGEDGSIAGTTAGGEELSELCTGGYQADNTMQKIDAGDFAAEVQFGMAAESVLQHLENYQALNAIAAGVVEREIPLAEKMKQQLDGVGVSPEALAARSQRMHANLELMNYVLDNYAYEYNYAVSMRDTLESYHTGEELSAAAASLQEQLNAGIEALETIYETMQKHCGAYGDLMQTLGFNLQPQAEPESEGAAAAENAVEAQLQQLSQ